MRSLKTVKNFNDVSKQHCLKLKLMFRKNYCCFMFFVNLLYNMSVVRSNGTEVKRDFTSNDTVLSFSRIFSFFVFIMRSFVLLIV